jgi:hypothetical protein
MADALLAEESIPMTLFSSNLSTRKSTSDFSMNLPLVVEVVHLLVINVSPFKRNRGSENARISTHLGGATFPTSVSYNAT